MITYADPYPIQSKADNAQVNESAEFKLELLLHSSFFSQRQRSNFPGGGLDGGRKGKRKKTNLCKTMLWPSLDPNFFYKMQL